MTRHINRRKALTTIGAATATGMTGLAGCLGADGEYPSDPLTAIVPFDEGGGSDTIIRQMAGPLSEELEEDIRIENVPGAGAMRGIGQLITAEPDGYTFGKFNPLTTSIQALINPPDFEFQDLKGLATIGSNALVVITDTELEIEGLGDLVDRYDDGEIDNIGGLGAQYLPHAMFFKERYGMEWDNYIQYSGGGPINQAVASGEVPAAVNADLSSIGVVEEGNADVAAVLTTSGSAVFPDATNVTDQGFEEMDFLGQVTRSMWVPPETPEDRIEPLTEAVEATIESETIQNWADETNNRMAYGLPEEADQVLEQIWTEIPDVVDIEELREAAE
ncbi:Tripartite-type tricarboxylate transporter, receptor component TctC [Halobiforma haloterrestris]|uniref:Tripartite-type tricarboxylate transporter, receptor component TctC n=1 Tax=Natronobacterium haloterrestre TaxID=148448 RepID=A0A1I1L7V3_NATHA|nr:tripartite tricarboxylate transporter substrate-binding protein [Halobiforma haloterrestris]SFC69184.1 Tripartite-type tricarboxylate transporter, receptor component TctC [Halobiforma haloterrestris]